MSRKTTTGLIVTAVAIAGAGPGAALTPPSEDVIEASVAAGPDIPLQDALDTVLPDVLDITPDSDTWVEPLELAQTWGGGVGNDGIFSPGPSSGSAGQRMEPRQPRVQPTQPRIKAKKPKVQKPRKDGKRKRK